MAATYKKFSIMRLGLILSAVVFSAVWVSCEKAIEQPEMLQKNVRTLKNKNVTTFSYGDNILYLKKNAKKNLVAPMNKPDVSGYFRSIPDGLSIDPSTGIIDMNESLTGMPYKIFYVSNSGKLLDSTRLVISGIDYEDGIYELGKKNSANPRYNAGETFIPSNFESVFDETDTDDDGIPDVKELSSKKIVIDKKTGSIDLAASVARGMFGSANPANGENRDISFYYRVKDGSEKALNKLTIRIYYFKKKADIPETLKSALQKREAIDSRVNKVPTPGFSGSDVGTDPPTDPLGDLDQYGTRRPPLIIIIS